MNDSFIQNLSFDLSSSDASPVDQNEFQKEMKAAAFYTIHHLNQLFKEWHYVTRKKRATQDNEILFMRWKIEKIQEIYFSKWFNYLVTLKDLHRLGNVLLMSKNFFLWIDFIRLQNKNKYNFRQVIISRRFIYCQNYFQRWRYVIRLKRKYEWYSRNDEKLFGKKIIRAFQLCIEKNRIFEWAVNRFMEIRLHGFLVWWEKQCKLSRKARYIRRLHNSYTKQACIHEWYDSMKMRIRLRRKFRYANNYHKQQLLQYTFNRWHFKYYNRFRFRNNQIALSKFINYHIQSKAFHQLISVYNLKLYLIQTEDSLTCRLEILKIRHYFELWISSSFRQRKYYSMIIKINRSLCLNRLNFFFQKWKAKHTIINYYQTKVYKIRNSYKQILLRQFLLKWYSEFKYLISNKESMKRAFQFRTICLMLKAFRTFQCNVFCNKKNAFLNKEIHLLIIKICFKKWKTRHLKYRRRIMLISAVVKNWAKMLQRKMLKRWINYIKTQHEKAIECSKALLVFRQLQIALTVDSFVHGCPKNITSQECGNNDYDDTSIQKRMTIYACEYSEVKLDEPRIPSFMKALSPKKTISSYVVDLGTRFQELARNNMNGKSTNEVERKEMLAIIQQMNDLNGNE